MSLQSITKKKLLIFVLLFIFVLIPTFAFAQVTVNEPGPSIACQAGTIGVRGVLCTLADIFNAIIPVLVSLGVVYFVWGVVQYMIGGGEEAKKKGKDRIIYGIIGLAVIVSIWGIVNLVAVTFGIDGVNTPARQPRIGECNTSVGLLAGKPAFQHFAGYINCTIRDSIIPFLFAIALATFVWGVVKFFFINSDEEAKRSQGKQFMVWGIIALVVMLSVWGLVRILGNTFGVDYAIPKTNE